MWHLAGPWWQQLSFLIKGSTSSLDDKLTGFRLGKGEERVWSTPLLPDSGLTSGWGGGLLAFLVKSSLSKVKELPGLSKQHFAQMFLQRIWVWIGFGRGGGQCYSCLFFTNIPPLCRSFKFLVTFCCYRCRTCSSVASSKWLMAHPSVILRQAGEYVHFAWFPSSIFQTLPEFRVTQLETGFGRSSNRNGRAGPDDTITLFSMNTSANMLGWGGGFCRAGAKASV